MFLIPRRAVLQYQLRFPLADQSIVSPIVIVVAVASLCLDQVLKITIKGCISYLTLSVVAHINAIRTDIARDEIFAATRGIAHRPRRDPNRPAEQVAL